MLCRAQQFFLARQNVSELVWPTADLWPASNGISGESKGLTEEKPTYRLLKTNDYRTKLKQHRHCVLAQREKKIGGVSR
jgi:hypothetical protein